MILSRIRTHSNRTVLFSKHRRNISVAFRTSDQAVVHAVGCTGLILGMFSLSVLAHVLLSESDAEEERERGK